MWGTRGSCPASLNHQDLHILIPQLLEEGRKLGLTTIDDFETALRQDKFKTPLSIGGQTLCGQVDHKDQSFIIDMGSGLRDAGTAAQLKGQKEFTFFLTHLHWDHLLGLNFFIPIFIPGTKIVIYHGHAAAPQSVKALFSRPFFPVSWEANPGHISIAAEVEFRLMKLYEPVKLGDVDITMFNLDHPGGSFGYRFDAGGKSVSFGVDSEYKRVSAKELGPDLKFYQNLDLLIFDAQYSIAELVTKQDWGHCSPEVGVDLALREGIKNLLFLHHDPWADREKLLKAFNRTKQYQKSQLCQFKKIDKLPEFWSGEQLGPNLILGYDGIEVDLDDK